MNKWLSSYRNRLTTIFGGMTCVALFSLTLYIDQKSSSYIAEEYSINLMTLAKGLSDMLGATLTEREREIMLLSQRTQLIEGNLTSAEIRTELERIQQSYPHYAWIGITDTEGVVQSSTLGLLEGQAVAQRPWFIHGQS
ncbi:MAG: hypothetical protein KDI50_06250 [Candidatus Competibacteraceae bacterium]|nr:hypothetical protein [Candidatus Competibacteraceae bacterium]